MDGDLRVRDGCHEQPKLIHLDTNRESHGVVRDEVEKRQDCETFVVTLIQFHSLTLHIK